MAPGNKLIEKILERYQTDNPPPMPPTLKELVDAVVKATKKELMVEGHQRQPFETEFPTRNTFLYIENILPSAKLAAKDQIDLAKSIANFWFYYKKEGMCQVSLTELAELANNYLAYPHKKPLKYRILFWRKWRPDHVFLAELYLLVAKYCDLPMVWVHVENIKNLDVPPMPHKQIASEHPYR